MSAVPHPRRRKRPLYRYVVQQEAIDLHESVVTAHNREEAIRKAKLGEVESEDIAEQWKQGRLIDCTRGERVDDD